MQEIGVWLYEKMAYAQPNICPREWNSQTHMGVWDTNGSHNLGEMTRPNNNQQKRETLQNCGLCCPGGSQSKIEEMRKER